MKKNYQIPQIWIEELKAENPLLASNLVTNVESGDVGIGYGGGGSGGARAGESTLWDDDEENDSDWDRL